MRNLEDQTILLLLIAISLAFAWIAWQFYGGVLWGIIAAIVFAPLYRRLLKVLQHRRSLAAFVTVLIIVLIVILPLVLITISLIQEASGILQSIQSGELDLGLYFQQVLAALPAWALNILNRFGLTNLEAVQQRLSTALVASSEFFAARVIDFGQNTVSFIINLFVMLYLLFFLLRDGDIVSKRIKEAIPLRAEQQRALLDKFTVVVRATIKGNIVVAIVQGALGGLIFWILGIHAALLWAVLMAFFSLLPAVGTGLIWLPVAIYLILTGSAWKGIILVAYGMLVIGLVDNFLRPVLVGKDTKMPDYVVLISTLGGIAIFGVNGFVIGPLIAAMFITVWHIFSTSSR
jgi:predicted PurR-regulated permease PerM